MGRGLYRLRAEASLQTAVPAQNHSAASGLEAAHREVAVVFNGRQLSLGDDAPECECQIDLTQMSTAGRAVGRSGC